MKARISQLHKTDSEWAKLANWTPAAGELIVFDPDNAHSYARLKIGDGKTVLKSLPFCIDSTIDSYLQKQRYSEVIDGGRITDHTK